MMIRKIVLVSFLYFLAMPAFSQQTWFESDFSVDVLKKLELSISPQVRFRKEFELKEYFIEASAEYKLCKYFSLASGYRLGTHITEKKGYHESFGRFNVDAKTGYKWKGISADFRLRFANADDFSDDNEDVNYFRYKLKLAYDIKKLMTEPYILYEWYHDVDAEEISKGRFETGVTYKINKHHKVGVYYRNNNYLTTDDASINIWGLCYKFKF